MPNIARKFESGVGFSNGCALLALKKPPPLVPNCLMISCDATGPCAIVCSRHHLRLRLAVGARGASRSADRSPPPCRTALKFCTTPCETRNSEPTIEIGSSTQSERAHHVDPEVAERVLLLLRDAADERDRHRDADRRRHEVVVREAGHLREVAHRRLAAVGLPVRVGRERRGGVEGQVGRDGAEALRVERQQLLQPLHRVEHQHRDDAEQQQRDGVLGPSHLVRLVDAGQPVDQPLDRPQHRIEPRPLTREHPAM